MNPVNSDDVRQTRSISIVEAFEQQVHNTPSNTALITSERRITYAELNDKANEIALQIPHGQQFIGLVVDHSIQMIASILAILKTGAAYVPVEPSFPLERIHYIFNECGVSSVITQQQYTAALQSYDVVVLDDTHLLSKEHYFSRTLSKNSAAYVLYTSGTTGTPKGIIVEHTNVINYVNAFTQEFEPTTSDIMLQNSVCTFDIFVEEVFPLLLRGGAIAIPNHLYANDATHLVPFIKKAGVTIISGFPYLAAEFNKLERIPPSVRLFISGGDVLRYDQIDNLLDQVMVYNTYGPSETTVCASYYCCNTGKPYKDGTYPIGKAIKGVEIELCDESMQPVAKGNLGEIVIYGAGVSRGYVDDKEHNHAFGINGQGAKYYRSGDLALELSDGNLVYRKRKDAQVMIEGKRVEPLEVENVLEQNSLVEQAFVIAEVGADNQVHLSAYIMPKEKSVTETELRLYQEKYLPEYMIPERFYFIDKVPRLSNGKPDRTQLLGLFGTKAKL